MSDEQEHEPTAAAPEAPESDDPELDAAIEALSNDGPERPDERRIWLMLVGGGVIVLIIFLLLFWPVMKGRLDAVKQVDQAEALLGQAENTIGDIDKTVTAQLSPNAAPSVPSVAAQILVARRELAEADKLITGALPHLTEDEASRATLLQNAVKARQTMIDAAPAILIASTKAVQAKSLGDQAMTLSGRAEAAEGQAIQGYRNQGAAGVYSALVAANTIADELDNARSLYSQAASAFPDAGFEQYVAYVDLQLNEAALLKQAASAWLAHDLGLAKALMSSLDVAVGKTQAAKAKLPYAPGTATGAAFKKLAGRSADAYASAKKQADAADQELKASP